MAGLKMLELLQGEEQHQDPSTLQSFLLCRMSEKQAVFLTCTKSRDMVFLKVYLKGKTIVKTMHLTFNNHTLQYFYLPLSVPNPIRMLNVNSFSINSEQDL